MYQHSFSHVFFHRKIAAAISIPFLSNNWEFTCLIKFTFCSMAPVLIISVIKEKKVMHKGIAVVGAIKWLRVWDTWKAKQFGFSSVNDKMRYELGLHIESIILRW